MDSLFWKLLCVSFLLINFSHPGCSAADDPNPEDLGYFNDEDDDDDEEFTGPPPEITSKAQHVMVVAGENAYFPCDRKNDEMSANMWYHDNLVLFADSNAINKDARLGRFQNNTLVIYGVKSSDWGVYCCRLESSPRVEVNHTLTVIQPSSNQNNPISHNSETQKHQKQVHKNEPFTLSCEVEGHPKPTVTWVRENNKPFPNGKTTIEGTSYTVESAAHKHSGIYRCFVSNRYGNQSITFDVRVVYAPDIEIEEDTITTNLGLEQELICVVHSEPKAKVTWYRHGRPLVPTNHVNTMTSSNRHVLLIKGVEAADFGTYTCHAQNEYGTSQRPVTLSGVPKKPEVRLYKTGSGLRLDWTVESYTNVKELQITYSRPGYDNETVVVTVDSLSTEGKNVYRGEQILKDLPNHEDVVIHIRAKNNFGWSQSATITTSASGATHGSSPALQPPFLVFSLFWAVLLHRVCL